MANRSHTNSIPLQRFATPPTQDPSLLSSHPTASASTEFRNKLFVVVDADSQRDELEDDIYPLTKSQTSARKYLQDYSLIKHSPGGKILHALLRYLVYQGSAIPQTLHADGLLFSSDITPQPTFSDSLRILKDTLKSPELVSLRLCVLFFGLPNNIASKLFSYPARAFTTRDRLQLRFDAPAKSILYTIRKEWDPDRRWLQKPFGEPWCSQARILPSKAKTRKPFSVDHPKQLTLTWISTAPEYHSNFYEYVWERQIAAPTFEKATISSAVRLGSRNTVLIFTTTASYDETKGQRAKLTQKFQDVLQTELRETAEMEFPVSIETNFVLVVFRLFILVIGEIEAFHQGATHIVQKLTYIGRERPSGNKLNYLSHLEDCRCFTESSLAAALEIMSEISDNIQNNPRVDQSLLKVSKNVTSDIVYLQKEIGILKQEVENLYQMLRDKLDLRQITRTYVLTFLAGIYLPFSFMASLYGMNISTPLWNQPSQNSTSHNSSTTTSSASIATATSSASAKLLARQAATDLSLIAQNASDAIVNAIQTNSYNWTFRSYWCLTVPITIATIIIPVFADKIIRLIAQSSYRHSDIWSVFMFIVILIVLICLDFFVLLASMSAGKTLLTYYLVFGLGLCLPALLVTIRAFYIKNHRIIWTVFLALSLFCTFTPFQNVYVIIGLSYLPYIYLFVFWFRHEFNAYLVPRLGIFAKITGRRITRRSKLDFSTVEEGATRSELALRTTYSSPYFALNTHDDILAQVDVPGRH